MSKLYSLLTVFVFVVLFIPVAEAAQANNLVVNNGKVFTAADFAYIPDFSVSPSADFTKVFLCPGYGDVIRGFGKASSETEDALQRVLTYEFGNIVLRSWDNKPSTLWLTIINDKLDGPRGIKVGDPCEKVLAAFKNKLALLHKGEFKAALYEEGKRPVPAYLGRIFQDSRTGRIISLYYWHGNKHKSMAISVNFVIENGVVSKIMWSIDERA